MVKIFIMTTGGEQLEYLRIKNPFKYIIYRGRLLKRNDKSNRSYEYIEKDYVEIT